MTGAVGSILTVLIMAGVTARLTVLITEDVIAGPLRKWIMVVGGGPDRWPYQWVKCPWCVGLWLAFAVTLSVWGAERLVLDAALLPVPGWLWVPGLALTNNYLAARAQA